MIGLKTNVGGRYRATVKKESGEISQQTGWFDNLITDNGLDLMNAGTYLRECAVGTGTTTPAVSDVQLDSLLASTQDVSRTESRDTGTAPYVTRQTATFTFSAGAAAGNVAELGVGDSATDLFSRALIEDGAGDPTTITVLSDEILVVEYELNVEIPGTDNTGTININGTDYDWTGRALGVDQNAFWDLTNLGPAFTISTGTTANLAANAYDGDIVAATGADEPTGTAALRSSISVSGYTSGDFSESATITWDPGVANFGGGIGAVRFTGGSAFAYQIGFSPNIPKTSDDEFTLTVSHSWGRA